MSCGTLTRLYGPAYIANSATNIYNNGSALLYTEIRRIHICNVTTASATFTLCVGGTGVITGGTELYKTKLVPSNDVFIDWRLLKMISTDFLVGICETGSSKLTIEIEGYLRAV